MKWGRQTLHDSIIRLQSPTTETDHEMGRQTPHDSVIRLVTHSGDWLWNGETDTPRLSHKATVTHCGDWSWNGETDRTRELQRAEPSATPWKGYCCRPWRPGERWEAAVHRPSVSQGTQTSWSYCNSKTYILTLRVHQMPAPVPVVNSQLILSSNQIPVVVTL